VDAKDNHRRVRHRYLSWFSPKFRIKSSPLTREIFSL